MNLNHSHLLHKCATGEKWKFQWKWGYHLFRISVLSSYLKSIPAFKVSKEREKKNTLRIASRMERYLGRCGSRFLWSWLVSYRGQGGILQCHTALGPACMYSGCIRPGPKYHLPHTAGLQELGKPPCPFPQVEHHCLTPLNQTQRI